MKMITLIVIATSVVCGCAVGEPRNVDAKFGDSVNRMIVEQTYDPTATQRNDSRPPKVLDGEKAERTLNSYREDVPKGTHIENIINLDIGG
jgi:hypothetical protein